MTFQSEIGDVGGTSVTPKSPVKDSSQAVSAVAELGSLFGDALSGVLEQKVKARKEKVMGDFVTQITTLTQQGVTGKMDKGTVRNEGLALLLKAQEANPSSALELAKAYRSVTGVDEIGGTFTEDSLEEQRREQSVTDLIKSRLLRPGATREEQDVAIQKYTLMAQEAQAAKQKKMLLDAENADLERKGRLTDNELKTINLNKAKAKEEGTKWLKNEGALRVEALKNTFEDMKGRLAQGIPAEDLLIELRENRAELLSDVQQAAGTVEATTVQAFTKPLLDMYTLQEDILSGKISEELGNTRLTRLSNMYEIALLSNPELGYRMSLEKLAPILAEKLDVDIDLMDSALKLTEGLKGTFEEGVEKIVGGNGKPGATPPPPPPPPPPPDTATGVPKVVKAVFETIKETISQIGTDQEVASKEEVGETFNRLFDGVDFHQMSVKSPAQLQQHIAFLASPEVEEFLKNNPNIDPQLKSNAYVALKRSFGDVVTKRIVQDFFSTTIGDKDLKVYSDVMDIQFRGGAVVFVPKEDAEGFDKLASTISSKGLTRKWGALLTNIIKADTALGGASSAEESFTKNVLPFFQGKQEEEPEEITAVPPPETLPMSQMGKKEKTGLTEEEMAAEAPPKRPTPLTPETKQKALDAIEKQGADAEEVLTILRNVLSIPDLTLEDLRQ